MTKFPALSMLHSPPGIHLDGVAGWKDASLLCLLTNEKQNKTRSP